MKIFLAQFFKLFTDLILMICSLILADNILLPSSTNSSNNNNSTNNNMPAEPSKKPIAIGSTWTNAGTINIDFDNLVGKQSNKGPAPSMNQLKSATTSPVKSPPGVLSPMGNSNSNFMFAQSNNNNNNFNQFNAFQ